MIVQLEKETFVSNVCVMHSVFCRNQRQKVKVKMSVSENDVLGAKKCLQNSPRPMTLPTVSNEKITYQLESNIRDVTSIRFSPGAVQFVRPNQGSIEC